MGELTPFGGSLEQDDLIDYHYKMMMPYFDDPDELGDFSSFEEGVKIIRDNLKKGKGNTVKVYEQIFTDKKVAVFGVGLWNKENGEAHFLPIIGETMLPTCLTKSFFRTPKRQCLPVNTA